MKTPTKTTLHRRARRVWEAANGPIPDGFHIHHRDGNPENNALENLEALSAADHAAIHERKREPVTKTCERCGESFETTVAHGRFCSAKCKAAARRASGADHESRVCAICSGEFSVNRFDPTRTCSRRCHGILSGNVRRGVPQPKRRPRTDDPSSPA